MEVIIFGGGSCIYVVAVVVVAMWWWWLSVMMADAGPDLLQLDLHGGVIYSFSWCKCSICPHGG